MRRHGEVYRYYRCNQSLHGGNGVCHGTSVDADRLEDMVRVASERAPVDNGERDRGGEQDANAELRRGMARVQERIAKLLELFEMGEMDKGALQDGMGRLVAERDEMRRAVAEIGADPVEPGSLDDMDERGLVRAVVREITVKGRSAEVVLGQDAGTVTLSLVPECDTSTLAGRLRQWRLDAGLRQSDVAQRLGVSVDTVRNWEAGRCRPRGDLLSLGITNTGRDGNA